MAARADAGRSDSDATEALAGRDLRMAVPLLRRDAVRLAARCTARHGVGRVQGEAVGGLRAAVIG
eukprot:530083-Prymnesium_polylepis.1